MSQKKFLSQKNLHSYDGFKTINMWIDQYRQSKKVENSIGTMIGVASDFQNQRLTRIELPYFEVKADNHHWQIVSENLIQSAIYLSVRWNIPKTWSNDKDCFLYPLTSWESDREFQSDCLVNILFHDQNHITSSGANINHWIPFTREQVGCKKTFKSNFMSDFINGKIKFNNNGKLFESDFSYPGKMAFSLEAQAVYDAALEIWKSIILRKTPTQMLVSMTSKSISKARKMAE